MIQYEINPNIRPGQVLFVDGKLFSSSYAQIERILELAEDLVHMPYNDALAFLCDESPTKPLRGGPAKKAHSCPYDEEYDATDYACPSWWRGNDAGGAAVLEAVKLVLSGQEPVGKRYKPFQDVLDSIWALVKDSRELYMVGYEDGWRL